MTTIHLMIHHMYKQSFIHIIDQSRFELNFIFSMDLKDNFPNHNVDQISFIDTQYLLRKDIIDIMPEPFIMFGNLKQLYLLMEFQKKICGYITPDDSFSELSKFILNALQGEWILSPNVKGFLNMGELMQQKKMLRKSLQKPLTKSELEVLFEISKGNTNTEIAKTRYRSIHTIQTQRKQIRLKLKLNNKQKLTIFAAKRIDEIHTLLSIKSNQIKLKTLIKNTSNKV